MPLSVLPQGTLQGVNASFTAINPLGDPSLSTIALLTLYDLIHTVYLTGGGISTLCNVWGISAS